MKKTATFSLRLLGLALLLMVVSGGGTTNAQIDDPCQRNCQMEWVQAAEFAEEFYLDCIRSAGDNQSLINFCNFQTDVLILDADVANVICLQNQQHCGCTGAGGAF